MNTWDIEVENEWSGEAWKDYFPKDVFGANSVKSPEQKERNCDPHLFLVDFKSGKEKYIYPKISLIDRFSKDLSKYRFNDWNEAFERRMGAFYNNLSAKFFLEQGLQNRIYNIELLEFLENFGCNVDSPQQPAPVEFLEVVLPTEEANIEKDTTLSATYGEFHPSAALISQLIEATERQICELGEVSLISSAEQYKPEELISFIEEAFKQAISIIASGLQEKTTTALVLFDGKKIHTSFSGLIRNFLPSVPADSLVELLATLVKEISHAAKERPIRVDSGLVTVESAQLLIKVIPTENISKLVFGGEPFTRAEIF